MAYDSRSDDARMGGAAAAAAEFDYEHDFGQQQEQHEHTDDNAQPQHSYGDNDSAHDDAYQQRQHRQQYHPHQQHRHHRPHVQQQQQVDRGPSTWLGTLGGWVGNLPGSSILVTIIVTLVGRIFHRQDGYEVLHACHRKFRDVATAVGELLREFYNDQGDDDDEATVISDDDGEDEEELPEPIKQKQRSRRRRRRARANPNKSVASLVRRQLTDNEPPPLVPPGEIVEGEQDESDEVDANEKEEKIEQSKPKESIEMKELEPAFLRDCDYPPGWLVYHPVLGVVSKEEADSYDGCQASQSQLASTPSPIAAGG